MNKNRIECHRTISFLSSFFIQNINVQKYFLIEDQNKMFENTLRRKNGNIRLLEKQLRPEVTERILQFLDVIINQIIYQENIYHRSFHFIFDR